MKKLTLIAFLWLCAVVAYAAPAPNSNDTIIINYGDKGQIIIIAENAETLSQMTTLDLNKLMESVKVYADSARKRESRSLEVEDRQLGAFRIEVNEPKGSSSVRILFENEEGLFSTSFRGKQREESFSSDLQSDRTERRRRSRWRGGFGRTSSFFGLDFGLNTYVEDGDIPTNTNYELRPWGSRYVALSWKWRTRLARSVYFKYGVSVNWFNFMFNGNRRIITDGTTTRFIMENFDLEKTKLTVSYVNLPVMFQFGRSRSSLFRVGVGGYVGYRLGSYTKIKFDGDKDRDHDNFDLNPFRYGIAAELGFRRIDPRLFFNYDLNTLFDNNSRLPELNPISFGIRF